MYDPSITQPMRDELTTIGVQELRTPAEVDSVLGQKSGTTLLIVNSVCGCAAGMARPALKTALLGESKPDRVVSVFAGVDTDAARRARGYFAQFPPSSPSFAFFKDGEVVHFISRQQIEGRDAHSVASDLTNALRAHSSVPT